MSSRILTSLLALLAASCSGERVAVTLEQADIRTVDHATIFAKYMYPGAKLGKPRQTLHMNISSQTDLIRHFENRGKQLQVRCSVKGTKDGKAYGNSAFGPYLNASSSDTLYHYDIYAYIDLKADASEYKDGKPDSTIDLKSVPFESLICQLVGVEMAPLPYLRSNELVVSSSTFHDLLRQAVKQ